MLTYTVHGVSTFNIHCRNGFYLNYVKKPRYEVLSSKYFKYLMLYGLNRVNEYNSFHYIMTFSLQVHMPVSPYVVQSYRYNPKSKWPWSLELIFFVGCLQYMYIILGLSYLLFSLFFPYVSTDLHVHVPSNLIPYYIVMW